MLAKLQDGLGNQVLLLIIAYYKRGIFQSFRDARRAGVPTKYLEPLANRLRRLEIIEDRLRTNRWRHIKPAGL